MLITIIIHLLGTLILFCAVQVLRMSHKPVHSILYLVLCFILVCLFYFVMKLEFLGLIYIMVYVGAIAVLFLFVVMMLELKNVIKEERNFSASWIFGIGGFLVIVMLMSDVQSLTEYGSSTLNYVQQTQHHAVMNYSSLGDKNSKSDLFLLGFWMFGIYWDLLVILGLILLIAMVGAIVLVADAKHKTQAKRKFQNEGYQLNKNFVKSLQLKTFNNYKEKN